MKKLQAFVTAFILFFLFVLGFHALLVASGFQDSDGTFNRWYSGYKDKTAEGLAENLGEKTMLVFGSSEFGHLKDSPNYPFNLFSTDQLDVQVIAAPYEQSLSHAISLGALAPDLKNKKAVLVLSPTWFQGKGVRKEAFQLRFSDSLYIRFLQNPDIPANLKKQAARRVDHLLSKNPAELSRARLYRQVYLDGSTDPMTKFREKIVELYAAEQGNTAVRLALMRKKAASLVIRKTAPAGFEGDEPDWERRWQQADLITEGHANNPLGMEDSAWEKDFKSRYTTAQELHKDTSMTSSREYDDLELFLKVCRECGVSVKLVIQPVSGAWYDHTGLSQEESGVFHTRIAEMAMKYNAQLDDYGEFDHDPYILTDAVHPWEKGWLLLDDSIYSFYRGEERHDFKDRETFS